MADSVVFSGVSSHVLSKNKGKISEYDCNKCSIYENQLKEALEELESARMIIDILQKELLTPSTKNACTNDSAAMQGFSEQVNTKDWTLVSSKNYTVKPNKNHKCESASPDQLVMTTNRFTPLYNLQANNAGSSGLQEQNKRISTQDMNTTKQHRTGMNILTIVGGRLTHSGNRKPKPAKKQTLHARGASLNNKKHKVTILGDSHQKGTATKIDQYLNTKFEVCSWVKPGANTEELVNTLEKVHHHTRHRQYTQLRYAATHLAINAFNFIVFY